MGFRPIPGLNSGELIGYGTATCAVDPRTATRDSSETSFLQTAAETNPQFMIYPDTLGTKILFDERKKANGVMVAGNLRNNPVSYQLNANQEVIVSGGVVRLSTRLTWQLNLTKLLLVVVLSGFIDAFWHWAGCNPCRTLDSYCRRLARRWPERMGELL